MLASKTAGTSLRSSRISELYYFSMSLKLIEFNIGSATVAIPYRISPNLTTKHTVPRHALAIRAFPAEGSVTSYSTNSAQNSIQRTLPQPSKPLLAHLLLQTPQHLTMERPKQECGWESLSGSSLVPSSYTSQFSLPIAATAASKPKYKIH